MLEDKHAMSQSMNFHLVARYINGMYIIISKMVN